MVNLKLVALLLLGLTVVGLPASAQDDGRPPLDDTVSGYCLSALVNLGYRRAEAARAVEAARSEVGAEAPFEALLKRALQSLVF